MFQRRLLLWRYVFFTGLAFGLASLARAQGEGSLTVRTDPEGIEVWVDDQFIGQSPIIGKKMKTGRYTIKLVDPAQHSSTNEEILIQDNEETVVERTITSKFGSLKVSTEPEGADVSIATELGKSPLANDFMIPGRYRLEIKPSNSRYLPKVTEVTITKGQMVTVEEQLKKKNFFTKKNIAAFCLFSGSAAGFIWAIAEQGNFKAYKERQPASSGKINGAALNRTLGIIIGSTCLIGLEIIALF
ncbi:MAG: PEGA domain-containing protein [Chitinispirillaceae bacterium]|nr:PEGA domain-containing protein [Chitinispirillaceae bacterium]